MSSTFEKEYGALGTSLHMSAKDTKDALTAYRKTAARLADAFAKNETAATARALSSYLLPSKYTLDDQGSAAVAKLFVALRAIDKETGAARNSEVASCTTDAAIIADAKKRAGITATFTLTDDEVSRLRGLV